MSSTQQSSIHHDVNPSEVGWQFVPKYYTFLNQQPNRLHCFYTKASTFIHGVEGEDGKPCHGQLEIHTKITSLGFQDCKVFIHSVDAQSSANGGITILVIGEMSNQNGPWRKFVQSFFLAEQPNGYFVLNDMFRFLKEETVESDEASEPDIAAAAPEVASVTVNSAHSPEPSPPPYESQSIQTPAPSTPAPPAPAVNPVVEEVPAPVPSELEPAPPVHAPETQPQANGIHATETEAPAPPSPVAPSPAPVTAQLAPQSAPNTASPSSTTTALPSAPPVAASPAPPLQQPQQQGVVPEQPVAAPAVPPAPRTWANLAAANPKKWGNAVAQESRGTTEVPAASGTPPASGTQTPASNHGQRGTGQHQHHQHQHSHQNQHPHQHQHQHGRGEHPSIVAAQNVVTAQCFVKGVTEPVSNMLLTNTLTTRFGPIKDLEIIRSKACAFFEFLSIESAKKAIITSLPQSQGGEGGIRIDVGGEVGQVRISVETRKERGERPVSRPRGGGPVNGGESRGGGGGGGGGSFRGRGGGRGGRGGGASGPNQNSAK